MGLIWWKLKPITWNFGHLEHLKTFSNDWRSSAGFWKGNPWATQSNNNKNQTNKQPNKQTNKKQQEHTSPPPQKKKKERKKERKRTTIYTIFRFHLKKALGCQTNIVCWHCCTEFYKRCKTTVASSVCHSVSQIIFYCTVVVLVVLSRDSCLWNNCAAFVITLLVYSTGRISFSVLRLAACGSEM